jgi:type I restriction enzyme S subunit
MPHDLPPGWAWSTIGETTEKTIELLELGSEAKFLYIDIRSIDTDSKRIKDAKTLSGPNAPSRARQLLQPDDVLVSMTRPYLNAVARVPQNMAGAVGSTGFYVLRTRRIASGWLFYLVQTRQFVESMSRLVQGALYPAIRPKDIDSYLIPVAPLSEQRRIISEIEKQFSRLDSSIDGLQRVNAKLNHSQDAVLRVAFEGNLVPLEIDLAKKQNRSYQSADLFLGAILHDRRGRWEQYQRAQMEANGKILTNNKWKAKYRRPKAPKATRSPRLPRGWTWTNLDQLKIFSLYGPRFSSEDYSSTGYHVLRTSDINTSGKVNVKTAPKLPLSQEEFSRYKIEQGDLLITRTGSIGTVAIFDDDIEAIPGAYLIHYRLAVPATTAWYVFYYLRSAIGQGFLVGGSSGVGRLNLNAPTIESVPIPFPPLEEQRRIILEIERRLSIIEGVRTVVGRNLKRTTMLRQRILHDAFNGSLVTHDASDEPAKLLLQLIRDEKSTREQEAKAKLRARRRSVIRRKSTKAKRIKPTTRSPLREALSNANRRLRPEELFAEAGFDRDDMTEAIDSFYKELAQEIKEKHIKETRPNRSDVYLQMNT